MSHDVSKIYNIRGMLIAGDRSQQNHHPILRYFKSILRMEMNSSLEPHTLLLGITSEARQKNVCQTQRPMAHSSAPNDLIDLGNWIHCSHLGRVPAAVHVPEWLGPRLGYKKGS